MKKLVNILSIVFVVLIIAQVAVLLLPNWTITPVADRLNPDPQPTSYSIFDYCWTSCNTMNKRFEQQFKDDYNGAKYNGNDYVIGLVLAFVFSLIAAAFSLVSVAKSRSILKNPAITILCHAFSLVWAYFAVSNYLGNFTLVLGNPVNRLLLIVLSAVAAVVVVARLVLNLITFIKDYRAEYCV